MLGGLFFTVGAGRLRRIAHLRSYSMQHLGCTFKSWNVKKTVVGQCALGYLNNHCLYAGYINYVLHKLLRIN